MSPIHSFMPTSNLIVKRPQITLELASKDVEKVAFQEMKKSFQSGKVNELVFIFNVSSKVRIYENLKNVFKEARGKQFSISQKNYEKSGTVKNYLQIPLNLSSKNVKNAFFEGITKYRSKNGNTSLAFTFTTLSVESIYEELESEYAELENDFLKESKESEKDNPPPIPWATHPSRRAISNPLYGLVPQLITKETPQLTKEKSLLKRAMGSFKKRFVRKPSSIPQARYTLHAFDSGFECDAGSENSKGTLNISCNKDPIYTEIDNVKKRNLSEDSGYESPREFSGSGYEIPRQVEPAIYLEVLP